MRTSGRPEPSTVATAMAGGSFGSLALASANHSSNRSKGSIWAVSPSSKRRSESRFAVMKIPAPQGFGRSGQGPTAWPYRSQRGGRSIRPKIRRNPMRDPYTVLGVPRSVSEKDLKSAYRKLAKANHPDQNQSDPKAQQQFAEISAAYDFLTDKGKKAAFDRGKIDADGNPKFAGFNGGGMNGGARRGAAGAGNFSAEDILKEFMSGFGGAQARPSRSAGFAPFGAGQYAGARQTQAR